ncbi:hypothetical protein MP638_002381 [Amoeboaphelidium occidentale]|nr:hypothetical protein MP638_002381 [Amoeboaphelidium occidentale]
MDEFEDFTGTPTSAQMPGLASSDAPVEDAVSDFLSREAQMAQELGESVVIESAEEPSQNFQQEQQLFAEAIQKPSSASFVTTSTPSSATAAAPQQDSEATAKWRLQRDQEIEKKDAAEKQKHQEILSKAKTDLENFFKEYTEKKKKNLKLNRESESAAAAAAAGAGGSTSGSVWERVAAQIDLTSAPATSSVASVVSSKKDASSNAAADKKEKKEEKKDTSRLKQIILQLKNDAKAPGNEVAA